mgnify:CR=1 FL=1
MMNVGIKTCRRSKLIKVGVTQYNARYILLPERCKEWPVQRMRCQLTA